MIIRHHFPVNHQRRCSPYDGLSGSEAEGEGGGEIRRRRGEKEPNGEWAGGKPIGSRRRMGRIREDGKGKGLYRAEKRH